MTTPLHLVLVMHVTARFSVIVGCSAFQREGCVPTDWVTRGGDARRASGLYNSRTGPTKWRSMTLIRGQLVLIPPEGPMGVRACAHQAVVAVGARVGEGCCCKFLEMAAVRIAMSDHSLCACHLLVSSCTSWERWFENQLIVLGGVVPSWDRDLAQALHKAFFKRGKSGCLVLAEER